MREEISFSELSKEQLSFVIQHLRDYDRVELGISGWTPENAWDRSCTCDETLCGMVNGRPVCVFGYVTTPTTIRFNFYGTDEVAQNWFQITRSAKAYIDYIRKKYWYLTPVIEVWEGHHQSRRWLKRLGFEETQSYRTTPHGRTIFLKFNKYNKEDLANV